MLLTPGLGWKPRVTRLALGLTLILAAHITAMNWISFAIRGRGG